MVTDVGLERPASFCTWLRFGLRKKFCIEMMIRELEQYERKNPGQKYELFSCTCSGRCEIKARMKQFSQEKFVDLDAKTIYIVIDLLTTEDTDTQGPFARLVARLLTALMNHLDYKIKLAFGKTLLWDEIISLMLFKNVILVKFHRWFYQKWIAYPKANFLSNRSDLRNQRDSIVYIVFSTKTKLCYVGETKNFLQRMKVELRNAYRAGLTHYNYKPTCQFFERRMGQIGAETWNYAFLENLGKLSFNAKYIRIQTERALIRYLQPKLNIIGMKKVDRKVKGKCGRPLITKRVNDTVRKPTLPKLTVYRVYEQRTGKEICLTPCLDNYVKCFKYGHTYTVETVQKGTVVTGWDFITNNLGTSKILPLWKNFELKDLTTKLQKNRVKTVTFQCNTSGFIHSNIDKKILLLTKNKNALNRELSRGTLEELLFIWAKVYNLPDWEKRRRALSHMGKYLRNSFGIPRVPAPMLIYEFHPAIQISRVKNVCKILTTKVLPYETASCINDALKLIPKRGKTISEFLSNAKSMANLEHFSCAGPPWCKGDRHFTADLRDMGGNFTNVGEKNANDVPIWGNTLVNNETIADWLSRLLLYKNGLLGADPTVAKMMTNSNYIGLYGSDGYIRCITKRRLQMLWLNYEKNAKRVSVENFVAELRSCVDRYPLRNARNEWSTPLKLFTWIVRTFSIKVERFASPLNFDESLNSYCSLDPLDKIFGALPDSITYTWQENGYANPEYTASGIVNSIKAAIYGTEVANSTNILLLPIWDSPAPVKKWLHNSKLILICEWPEGSFRFNSPRSAKPVSTTDWPVGLYATAPEGIWLSESAMKELNNISVALFTCKPTYHFRNGMEQFEIPRNQFSSHDVQLAYRRRKKHLRKELLAFLIISIYAAYLEISTKLPVSWGAEEVYDSDQYISGDVVRQVKKDLGRKLVVSPKDKNTGQLRVECQFYLCRRLKKEIYSCVSFKKTNMNSVDVMSIWKKVFQTNQLNRLGYWSNGLVPVNYTLPKQKDPIEKARLIAAYSPHPLRRIYKNASKILTWLFQSIEKRFGMFTLFRLDDIKKRVHQAEAVLKKAFGKETGLLTLQTDITKMFTNLKHESIIESVIWMCRMARKDFMKKKRKSRKDDNFLIISKAKDQNTGKYTIRWSSSKGTEDEYTTTLDELINIVSIDLKYSYQRCGSDIFKQTHGCPIGGFLSSIYANIKCARDEFLLMRSLGNLRERVYAIRQVDDLILWVAYKRNDRYSKIEAQECIDRVLAPGLVYTGGLTLEQQPFSYHSGDLSDHKFAGTIISVYQEEGKEPRLWVSPLNKNSDSLRNSGKQIFPRFVSKASAVPQHYKRGMTITSFIRLRSQSSSSDILLNALLENTMEMFSLGYEAKIVCEAISHLARTDLQWQNTAVRFLTALSKWLTRSTDHKVVNRTLAYIGRLKGHP